MYVRRVCCVSILIWWRGTTYRGCKSVTPGHGSNPRVGLTVVTRGSTQQSQLQVVREPMETTERAESQIMITDARPEHLAEIVVLARANQLEGPTETNANLSERGFLVAGFTEQEYSDFLRTAEYFYVLLDKNRVVGFLLAYSRCRIQDDDWLNTRLKNRFRDRFVLIKQVCVATEYTSRGLASDLYQHTIKKADGAPLMAAVVLTPANVRSIRFHEKLGFQMVVAETPPDGMGRGVWRLDPSAARSTDSRTGPSISREQTMQTDSYQSFRAQYETAMNLYLHEDQLNWSKLNNLFYITVGLIIASGIIIRFVGDASKTTPVSIGPCLLPIALVGIILSASFSVALWAGVNYMLKRKRAVYEIEKELVQNHGCIPILLRNSDGSAMNLDTPVAQSIHKSWTTWVLRLTPLVLAAAWVVLFVGMVFVGYKVPVE